MSETLTDNPEVNEPAEEEKGEVTYGSVSEYLSAYEESPQFQEVLAEREKAFKRERPNLKISREDLIAGSRMSPLYNENLIAFFRDGHLLPQDLNSYNQETQDTTRDYWRCIERMPNRMDFLRATAKSKEDEETKMFLEEKNREKFHTWAALTLMSEGITLNNGQKINCDEIEPDDDNALSLLEYCSLGRTLVSIISEENEKDIADPRRDEKKIAATRKFLDMGRYFNGHWVGLGEK